MAQSTRFPTAIEDQMNFITRSAADQQLRVVVSFSGRIDAGRMARSIRLSMDRDPVLGCRYCEQPNRTYWERRTDLDQLDLCTVSLSSDPQNDLLAYAVLPMDPFQDALIQARIFRTAENDWLCIKVNHVVADGAGSKEAAYLVADTYAHLEADPSYHPGMGKFNPRSHASIFKRVGLANIWKFRPKKLEFARPQFNLPFHGQENGARGFAMRRINPDAFGLLKDFAKRRGATINDVLLAGLYRALCANAAPAPDAPLAIQVPVDLRHFLPEGHSQRICNFSSALFPTIRFQPGESFEQTLSSVQSEMKRFKTRLPGLTGAMVIELLFLFGYAKAKQMISHVTAPITSRVNPLLLSNLGVLDQRRLVFGSQKVNDAFELGPVMFGQALMLTASTYADRLTLAMGYCQTNLDQETVDTLLDQVVDELLSQLPDPTREPVQAVLPETRLVPA